MALEYFQWTTRAGATTRSPVAPTRDNSPFEEINELVLLRPEAYFEGEKYRLVGLKGSIGLGEFAVFRNQPIHCHNELCQNGEMPPNLTIFRANDCRLWHWPRFPASIVEIEMKNACVQIVPDLGTLQACTILMLDDGIVADVVGPLPPRLEVLGLSSCAISAWTIGQAIPESLGHIFFEGNPSRSLRVVPAEIQRRFVRIQHRPRELGENLGNADGLAPIHAGRATPIHAVNIADNTQNVHESGFQESTKKNIQYLVRYRLQRLAPMSKETHGQVQKTRMGILGTLVGLSAEDSIWTKYLKWLNKITTLSDGTTPESALGVAEYFQQNPTAQEVFEYLAGSQVGEQLLSYMQTPYSLFGTNFIEISIRVVEKILDMSPDGDEGCRRRELMKRLAEEVKEGSGHCTIGMIVRLTNVFLGFDENIQMTASPATVLGGRIPVLLEKVRQDGGWEDGAEPAKYWKDVIEGVIGDMREMGLERTKWNNWIADFVDSYKNCLEKEGKIQSQGVVRMSEETLEELGIHEKFLEDQIRMWVGLVHFQ